MTGKRLFCAVKAAVLAAVVGIAPAFAQYTVTDPGAYSYFVEQIKQQALEIEQMVKQVETMGGVLTETEKIYKTATGHYNRAVGLVNRIQRIGSAISKESGGGIFGEAKKWGNVGRSVAGVMRGGADEAKRIGKDLSEITGEDIYVDTKRIMDEVFTDPRSITDPVERYRSLDRRYQVQQGALKEVVARSERTLAGLGDRLKVIEQLANMIDQTENQKDAQDLTNRLLVEVLATLTDMLQVAALSNQAEALAKYQGASDEAMQQRVKVLEGAQASTGRLSDVLAEKRATAGGGVSRVIRRLK